MKLRIMLTVAMVALVCGSSPAAGAAADPTQAFQVLGTVVAFTASSGSGMPMLTVEDTAATTFEVGLGPLWVLRDAGFSAEAGDQVQMLIFPCDTCAAPYVAAWVDNLTRSCSVELRDEDASPLWASRSRSRSGSARPGQGNGSGSGGSGAGTGTGSGQPGGSGNGTGSGPGVPGGDGGLDMTQVETVTGEVVNFAGQAGAGEPVLSLEVDGDIVEIVVSPYQPVAAAGFIIEPGLVLTVTYAPAECDSEVRLVTIAITDVATGLAIQLRDPETGFPMAPGGGHNRPNWP